MSHFNSFINRCKETMGYRQLTRAFWRSVVLMVLTLSGAGILELLVYLSREQSWSIVDRFPELINIFQGGFIYTWLELSVFWVRIILSPKLDINVLHERIIEQKMGNNLYQPVAAAISQFTQTLLFCFRMLLLAKLCQVI